MKSTKKLSIVQRDLQALLEKTPKVAGIVRALIDAGGRVLLVGGAVRDLFLGIETKDLDIEIHKLEPKIVEKTLKQCGPVGLVGKQFGVFRVHGIDIDWSLPRKDSSGRKPVVMVDPFMSDHDAFIRRDLTINAMGIDLDTFQLVDPFSGIDDIQKGILRAPDVQFFVQDPLRLFRVMQFIGRFEMVPDAQLNDVCTTMAIATISRERIETEFEKLLLKSKRPSLGIRWLKEIGRLAEIIPELAATIGIEQSVEYHPEGDVFEHSMQALDASVQFEYDAPQKFMIMYAALCHDVGKVHTTKIIDGRIRSLGHAAAGVAPTKQLLKRITNTKDLIDGVCKLVKYHMEPLVFIKGGAKPPAYKRLALKLAPHVNLQMLADVALADKQGRNPDGPEPLQQSFDLVDTFLRNADKVNVRYQAEKPILQGRDVMDIVQPGPAMGRLLARAYDIQIEEGITDKDALKKRVI